MNKKYDVVALGELLIDFTRFGMSERKTVLYEANPGGAPCNVLAMLTKLNKNCAFIGKVGDDIFGRMLKDLVEELGINISGLVLDKKVNTTLALVQNFENGDRDFSFYRNPGADMMLSKEDLSLELIENASIFHFGTLSMTHDMVREATVEAVARAKKNQCIISFDPNLRPPLWDKLEDAKLAMEWGMKQCDILKISDNELEFVTGKTSFDEGVAVLKKLYPNIQMINVTAGAEGSYSYYKEAKVFVPGYKSENTIDTTGAGDTFCACVLNYVCENGITDLNSVQLEQMLKFANAAASIITTRRGALRVMPELREIEEIV